MDAKESDPRKEVAAAAGLAPPLSPAPRILAVKLSSLGDLFHALPAVHQLKAQMGATVDWVTTDVYADLVRCFTDVTDVIPFPRRAFLSRFGAFVRRLRGREYDLVVDFQGLLKSAVVTRLARGKRRIGPSFHREGSRLFYGEIAGRRDRRRHAVEQCLDVVRHLGGTAAGAEFPVGFPPAHLTAPGPRAALLPMSRWPSKNWPVENFAAVGKALLASGVRSLYILGGAGDADVCGQLARALPGAVNLAGQTSLVRMGSVLKEMDVLVANDSGPVHMAAAIGTPCVVVLGPTDPARTGPFGTRHEVLRARLDCQPCLKRVCRRGDAACMKAVTPEQVAAAALRVLGLQR